MDKWTTLEPVKLYASATSTASGVGARLLARATTAKVQNRASYIGPLPIDLHLLILHNLPVSDIPAYARTSRSLSRLTKDEKLWSRKWTALGVEKHSLASVLDDIEAQVKQAQTRAPAPPTISVDFDDDFGDFTSATLSTTTAPPSDVDFFGSFTSNTMMTASSTNPTPLTHANMYRRAHTLLKPLLVLLTPNSSPHQIINSLFPNKPPLRTQARTLHLLDAFLSKTIQPVLSWADRKVSLRMAIDRFDADLLAAFERADAPNEKRDEAGMREAAWASWLVWERSSPDDIWEVGRVWAEKREIFYEDKWQPMQNISGDKLDFEAMDRFISHVLDVIQTEGSIAARVFPAEAAVLVAFAGRLANEVIAEYVTPLLSRARALTNEIFLQATAAAFIQSWRLVDAVIAASTLDDSPTVSKYQAEDVIYRMFEPYMDEYLDEEIEVLKHSLDVICKEWDKQQIAPTSGALPATAQFLNSQNPALMKRNVLASFANVLLVPVTIVPRAVGAFVVTGGTAAVNGLSMLNPQRWGTQGAKPPESNYHNPSGDKEGTYFENQYEGEKDPRRLSLAPASIGETAKEEGIGFDKLQLLLSLDIALQLIHADRECLKRAETFQAYPGTYGRKVRETIEELFILLLQTLNERHILPGFSKATEQMRTYKAAEHSETTSVAPLMQFFELAHVGDTIQSMVEVFFDKELARYIDRTDFLNGVVREKKRSENLLDDAVAGGLNAGTEVLMNQVEHIIWTRTGPREYYPQDGSTMDLRPTKGCRDSIACLEMHCKLLRGSTSKEVLEVFYQEVGIRLHAIIQKHIKRQIISLEGGFQVIADLNAYHTFISSLKVPQITSDFANLKMLGHVYIVSDAKDLAQIVKDVTRYGGSFRPEDIYEFLQRRSDWKKIEKTVDKTMYNLSFKEDCVICYIAGMSHLDQDELRETVPWLFPPMSTSEPVKTEVLVVGFGAVGVIYSYILQRSGSVRVTAVARGNYEAVQENGIHIRSQKFGDIPGWKPDRLCRSVSEAADRPYDYVIITTKCLPEVASTAAILAPLLEDSYQHPQPTYVLFQNGLAVERDLYEATSKLKDGQRPLIVNAAVYIMTNLVGDKGDLVEHGTFDKVILGIHHSQTTSESSPPTNSPEEEARLNKLADAINGGGGDATIVADVSMAKFEKNIWNATFACCCTLIRHPVPSYFQSTSTEAAIIPVIRGLGAEILAVGRALGYTEEHLPSSLIEDNIARTTKLHSGTGSTHKPSMLLDLYTGRPIELEVILGEIVRAGHRLKVDVPRLETVYGLLSVVQGQLLNGRP